MILKFNLKRKRAGVQGFRGKSIPGFTLGLAWAFVLTLFLGMTGCDKKQDLTIKDVNKLLQKNFDELTQKRKFKVSPTGALQNIVWVKKNSQSTIIVFDVKEGQGRILKEYAVQDEYEAIQLRFINPGQDYSHLALLQKNKQSQDYLLTIFDCHDFEQNFSISKDKLNELLIKKNPKNENEEVIELGQILYRFDSFQYIETIYDMPLFFLHPIAFQSDETTVVMSNRGGYSGRSYITFSFPDYAKNPSALGLTKKIDTVKFISAGRQVYMGNGVYVAAQHPLIEITKQPFPGANRMRLPLKLQKEVGTILVRVAYDFRGALEHWPSAREQKALPHKIVKDQQGFWAYKVQ